MSETARDEILTRIRHALSDEPRLEPIPRDYHGAGWSTPDVDLFLDRVADYRAGAIRVEGSVSAAIAALGAPRLIVAPGFPQEWIPLGVPVLLDDPPLSRDELDSPGAVLTTCAVAVGETGTVVLDHGPGQGRRALTLIPDHHIVVVRRSQIAARVPDAFARVDPNKPQTWTSGPSATSDIELERVEGVHGPRRLDVLVVDD